MLARIRHIRMRVMLCAFALSLVCPNAKSQEVATTPEQWAAWRIPTDDRIRSLLAERMQHDGVGVVVGVIEPSGRRVFVHGRSGTARRLDGDTLFQIGSVTKTFTGLLLADMVQRGELHIDDAAQKYLPPNVSMPAAANRTITLMDLATHQSGLPSMPTNFALLGRPNPYEAYSTADLYEFLSSHSLPRPPGSRVEYSNLGVALLGHLLARRMDTTYESLLRKRVLEPLGMTSTSITLDNDQNSRLALGHDRFLVPVETWNLVTMPASGSLRSSANDLLNYLEAILGHRESPLNAAFRYQLNTRQPVESTSAVAWGVSRSGTREVFGHDGGKEGYRSAVVFNPRTRSGIVVLANARTDDRPMALARHLLYGLPMPPPTRAPIRPPTFALDATSLEQFAGRYELGAGQFLTIAPSNGRLLVATTGGGVATFYPTTPTQFFSNTEDEQLFFERNSAGGISGVTFVQGEKTRSVARVRSRDAF